MALAPSIVRDALAGSRTALRAFVDAMTPVIQARVVRGLLRARSRAGAGRDLHQEVEDLTQDVFTTLFAREGHAIRAWDPERGLSLANFVGLIAERHVATTLRSGRRNPWRDIPEELDDLETVSEPVAAPEPQIHSRRALELLLDRMREALSPRGLELFERLYVDEEPIEDVAVSMGMTKDGIYAWRSRTGKILRRVSLEINGDGPSADASRPRIPERANDDG